MEPYHTPYLPCATLGHKMVVEELLFYFTCVSTCKDVQVDVSVRALWRPGVNAAVFSNIFSPPY